MAVETPQTEKGLKLPSTSEVIAWGIDVITSDKTLDIFLSLFRYEERKGYREGVLHYLAQGYYPVGVFNHLVHADGFAYAITSENLVGISEQLDDPGKHLLGCYGIHQGTIESGAQGEDLQTYTLKLEAPAGKRKLKYLPWTTPEHVKRYNLDKEEVKKQNDASSAKMKSAPGERIALLTFPAGNMKAARKNDEGQPNGMLCSDLTWITQMATFPRDGVKIVFLPGVIMGTPRITDPDTRNLTPEAAWSFARNLLSRSALPIRPSEAKLASLTMLPPYPVDRLVLDLGILTGRRNIDLQNLRSLGNIMHANKVLSDKLIMGTINDELPDYLKGSYYKGYKSFGLGDYTSRMY